MDFFAKQEQTRRSTRLLVVLFALAVIGLILAVYASVALTLAAGTSPTRDYSQSFRWWNPLLFFGVSAGVLVVIFSGMIWMLIQLRAGGRIIAERLGGRRVAPSTKEPLEHRLMNVIEEMSIASGISAPVPYILDGEMGINAFAAGFTSNDAVIAVTEGALKMLNRDELQGVIGHEFSHVLNGDMRINVRLVGLVHGITLLYIIGRGLIRIRSSGRKGNPLAFFGLFLILIGLIGVFFGRLIKAAVSRERERLADASATQFTRNPSGLANALKKIGGLAEGSHVSNIHAEEMSHFFFSPAVGSFFTGWFSTHPPLEERIAALDPAFRGDFPEVTSPVLPKAKDPEMSPLVTQLLAQTGVSTPAHLEEASELLKGLPQAAVDAAHHVESAQALVLALLVDSSEATRSKQLQELSLRGGKSRIEEILTLHGALSSMTRTAQIALMSITVPTLRSLDEDHYNALVTEAVVMVQADQKITLFEFLLTRALLKRNRFTKGKASGRLVKFNVLAPLLPDAANILASITYMLTFNRVQASQVFSVGMKNLSGETWKIPSPDRIGLRNLNASFDRWAAAAPDHKYAFLKAAGKMLSKDGRLSTDGADLFRMIANALECPIPPQLRAA